MNGADQTIRVPLTVTVTDGRATPGGWSLQLGATTFTNERGKRLGATALRIAAVSATCTQGTCGAAVPAGDRSLVIPAAAPAGLAFFSQPAGATAREVSVTPVLSLTIPANAYAGTYTGTITITVTDGP